MKCVLCTQRKGKRSCPAKNDLICAQCCGEKRIIEIDCPESCEYLKAGRNREITGYTRHLRGMGPQKLERNKEIFEKYKPVVALLEHTLSRERLSSRDVTDNDVAQALDLVLDAYRTEEKGVLYEKTSDNFRVDYLRRELRNVVESYRNPQGKGKEGIIDPQQEHLSLKAAIECVEYVRDMAASYMDERLSPTGYLDVLARISTRDSRENSRSSIIIP